MPINITVSRLCDETPCPKGQNHTPGYKLVADQPIDYGAVAKHLRCVEDITGKAVRIYTSPVHLVLHFDDDVPFGGAVEKSVVEAMKVATGGRKVTTIRGEFS